MDIEKLREEAANLGLCIYNPKSHLLTLEEVESLACACCNIKLEDFKSKQTRSGKPEHAFARALTAKYLMDDGVMSDREIAKRIGVHRATLFCVKRSIYDDLKYFNPWRRSALIQFDEGIKTLKAKKHEVNVDGE